MVHRSQHSYYADRNNLGGNLDIRGIPLKTRLAIFFIFKLTSLNDYFFSFDYFFIQ